MTWGKLFSGYPVDFYSLQIVVAVDRHNKISYSFNKKFVDITPKPVSIKSFKEVDKWYDDSMLYYFQQYKFALYCATALCGISKDHLTNGLSLTKAIMNFHVMYQTKKILTQMGVRNPNDQNFNPYNNPYDKTEYQKLLNEFNVSQRDIPEIDQPAGGLGSIRVSNGSVPKDLDVQKKGGDWGTYYQFPPWNSSVGVKMDSVTQDAFNYNRVVPDHGKGFTPAGIVRLNDSIRAYVYCLLGAQVQARKAGSSLESQQEFLTLVNDIIAKKQSLEESISNFEDALSKTRGKINYVIAKDLYMIPADMNINELGETVKGFNDELKVAQAFDGIGIKPPPPAKPKTKPIQL